VSYLKACISGIVLTANYFAMNAIAQKHGREKVRDFQEATCVARLNRAKGEDIRDATRITVPASSADKRWMESLSADTAWKHRMNEGAFQEEVELQRNCAAMLLPK
jgi:hypothetical protein